MVRLKAATDDSKRLKELESVGTPVWGDELYELTARIKDVNALRVTSVTFEPVTRTPTSKVAGRMTIKGRLVNKSRKPLDDLISEYRRDSLYYSVQAPKVENNETFTLVVNMTRRPPTEYKSRLDSDQGEKDKTKTKGKN